MKRGLVALLFALFVSLGAGRAGAEVLLLAHGYLGSAHSWESTGITAALEADGWQRTGILSVSPMGVHMLPAAVAPRAGNKVYLAELPSAAPIGIQANHLQAMLEMLVVRHPTERVIIVGHSVGGVVARLTLVRRHLPRMAALITIAAPHLGTPRAEQALDVTDESGPFGFIKDFFGGGGYQTLKYSRGLYIDIVRPLPGSLLFWLNGQPHPGNLRYISVVRGAPFALWGDDLVPGFSQDMNNVPALAGRATAVQAGLGHVLHPGDGPMLVNLLKEFSGKTAVAQE